MSDPNVKTGVLVRVDNVEKIFHRGSEDIHVLSKLSLQVPAGEFLALMGPSGSGKSTLLNLLGCLDKPSSGEFFLGDDDVSKMSDDQLSMIRASRIGFVFQSYNLIQQLTVVENIEVPLYYQGRAGTAARCPSSRR